MSYDPCHICGVCAIKTDSEGRHVCQKHAYGESLPLPSKALRMQATIATLAALGMAEAPLFVVPKSNRYSAKHRCVQCGDKIREANSKCQRCQMVNARVGGTLSIQVDGELVKVGDLI